MNKSDGFGDRETCLHMRMPSKGQRRVSLCACRGSLRHYLIAVGELQTKSPTN